MGIGVGLGAFAQGLAGGLKTASDLEDARQRRETEKQRLAMEETRLGFERDRAEREKTIFGYTEDDLKRRKKNAGYEDQAKDMFLEAEGILTGKPSQPTAPQAPAAPQAISAPTPEAAPMPAPEAAPAPGGATPFPVRPQTPMTLGAPGQPQPEQPPAQTAPSNPFVTKASPTDLDRAYDLKAKALQLSLVAKGDIDKAMQVPKMMRELRDFDWTNKVGASLSGMVVNAPGAREAFATVYNMVNDGYSLDVKSGKFDPQNGWTGLVRVNDKTGGREPFDLSPTQAAVIAQRYKDPAAVIQYVQNRSDIAKKQALEDREVGAKETTAAAHTTSAAAAMKNANTNEEIKRDNAETNKTTRAANQAILSNQERARTEGEAQKFFRNSFGVGDFSVKTADEVKAMLPDEKKAYAAARQKQEIAVSRMNAASGLWDLNQRKFTPSEISTMIPIIETRIKSGKGADGVDEASGLPFMNINGKKVLLPKD
jgi:hypothetical protein